MVVSPAPRGLAQERSTMRKQKEEAERYTQLHDKQSALKQRLYLLRLFLIEKEIAKLKQRAVEAREDVGVEEARYESLEVVVQENEKSKANATKKVVELERKAAALQQQLEGQTPDAIQRKEEILHAERRRAMSEKSLNKLLEQQAQAEQELATMQSEYDAISQSIARLEGENDARSGREGFSMGDQQRAQYNDLKAQVGTRTASLTDDMMRKKRELRDCEPVLVQLRTRADELSAEKRAMQAKLSAFEERLVTSQEKLKTSTAELNELQVQAKDASAAMLEARNKRATLAKQISEMQGKLRSSKVCVACSAA